MDYILGFVILLGVLIFIHEFGHFIAAKYFKMRVEVFSIGMGKKLFSHKWGETEYSLSLFPIGGYVKITGQDPREEVPPELESRAFRNKPLFDRTIVVLAGPLFNAILAYLIFVFLFATGIPTQDSVLPRVLPASPAYQAGFRSGDRVLSINAEGKDVRVRHFAEFDELVADHVGKNLVFNIERTNFLNQAVTNEKISFAPVLGKERDLQLPVTVERGVLPGLERMQMAPVVSSLPNSWADARKLPGDFWVKEIRYVHQGVEEIIKVESLEQLSEAWQSSIGALKGNIKGEVRFKGFLTSEVLAQQKEKATAMTEPAETTVALSWSQAKDFPSDNFRTAGFVSSEFRVAGVLDKSPADKLGLQKDDLLLTLNGQELQSFTSFRSRIQDLAAEKQALKISVLRKGEMLNKELQAVEVANEDPDTGSKSKQFQIGVQFTSFPAAPALKNLKADGIIDNITLSWNKFISTNMTMLGTFYYLAKGEISGKSLGGPLLIGKIAGESFKAGGTQFLQMMSFLSLNLFIFNLLPIPVLDGGHLVLFAIEAIRRKPLGIKIIEVWTTTGFFILMGLIVFVFFNDISRLGFLKVFGL